MNAEQISEELGIARSNVSNSLKELVSWRLIRRVPFPGDRRKHFAAEVDVWEMGMRISQGRKERDIDPVMAAIAECIQKVEGEADLNPVFLARLQEMQDFLVTADRWYTQMLKVPKSKLKMLMKMGDKMFLVLKLKDKRLE